MKTPRVIYTFESRRIVHVDTNQQDKKHLYVIEKQDKDAMGQSIWVQEKIMSSPLSMNGYHHWVYWLIDSLNK